MQKKVLWLIVISTAVRMILASYMGFGVDETYELCLARTFSWSYFEFPPIVAWIPHFIMSVFDTKSTLFIRLPFILMFSGSTWLMYSLTKYLFSEKAGFYAALTLNLAGVFFLQGAWALPDVPLEFFMLATVFMLVKIIFPEGEKNYRSFLEKINTNEKSLSWFWAGAFFGLALMSKYHAIFIPCGILLFIMTERGYWKIFLSKGMLLATFVALVIFFPVIYWNSMNDWITISFQGSRYAVLGLFPEKMLINILGQMAWLLPWIWLPLFLQAIKVFVSKFTNGNRVLLTKKWFLFCIGIIPLVLFTSDALFGSWVYPHWLMPGYLFFFPLLGRRVAKWVERHKKITFSWLGFSIVTLLLIIAVFGSHTVTGWINNYYPRLMGKEDQTLGALAWDGLETQLYENGWLNKKQEKEIFIVTPHWIDAAKVDWVIGEKIPVLCLDGNPHHYVFLHKQKDFKGKNALIIGREKSMEVAFERYKHHFETIKTLGTVWLGRNGKKEMPLTVMLAIKYKGDFPLPYGLKD